jgi:hypothetical protein
VTAAKHLVGGLHDGVGQSGFQTAGLLVYQGSGALDPDDRVHERRERPETGDGKVFSSPKGLNAV